MVASRSWDKVGSPQNISILGLAISRAGSAPDSSYAKEQEHHLMQKVLVKYLETGSLPIQESPLSGKALKNNQT